MTEADLREIAAMELPEPIATALTRLRVECSTEVSMVLEKYDAAAKNAVKTVLFGLKKATESG